jgi:hypothetical protein
MIQPTHSLAVVRATNGSTPIARPPGSGGRPSSAKKRCNAFTELAALIESLFLNGGDHPKTGETKTAPVRPSESLGTWPSEHALYVQQDSCLRGMTQSIAPLSVDMLVKRPRTSSAAKL